MPVPGPALLRALWALCALVPWARPFPASFSYNGTRFRHLVRDPLSGTLYVGATNFLFQLSVELTPEAVVPTGPVMDSRDCLPPVSQLECPQATSTDNHNQLLLVNEAQGALIACGSVHQGVCEQRRLGELTHLLLRPERPGDTQYVAANDPAVSTVGLVGGGPVGEPLLFVGRGYTSKGVGGGIPPITTRVLSPPDPQSAFSYEETAKLAVGRLSEYSHHFVTAFTRQASVYFLFYRRDLRAQSREFRPYISRVCLGDQHYYSYVELPLSCQGASRPYGLVQAAAVAVPGAWGGPQGEVLFAAFSVWPAPSGQQAEASALCAFSLDEVDRLANATRDACYTREGRAEDGAEAAYIEYDVNSNCAQLPADTLDAYPCGSDHTPSPMASSVPLEAVPVLEWPDVQLTAVAVSVEDGHTIVFLGCAVDAQEYEVSSSIVCVTGESKEEKEGYVVVEVPGGGHGISVQKFTYQNPELTSIFPTRGPKAGGTCLTLTGSKLLTGRLTDIRVMVGDLPCHLSSSELQEKELQCQTSPSNGSRALQVTVQFGDAERRVHHLFQYTPNPNLTSAGPAKSFFSGGREIRVHGQNLDVVQTPRIRVTVSPWEQRRRRRGLGRKRRMFPETECPSDALCSVQLFEEPCLINSSQLIICKTPAIHLKLENARIRLEFILDNLRFDFNSLHPSQFSYEANPTLRHLNAEDPAKPYRHKPGSVLSVEGENLDLAISKEEVVAMIGKGSCLVKTLTKNHLYCEPPAEQPAPQPRASGEGPETLPEFTVQMGNLQFRLGRVQYDTENPLAFPVEAQVGLGVGASLVALVVLIIVFIYRRKSKQALRDYKKVQIQLENLETSVRDRCKKEFTDLMTEMTDLTSDLVGSGIPFLDYKSYAERVFFPGHRESPLQRDLDVPTCRRQTVEQGLVQLSNLLNSKLFLTKFIHTLECQRTFSPRDRAYVASLLTVALHGKLEYFTDILKTLLSDLVEQYVAKNPKLMLRRTETVVEKLLTNWMSICLYTFVRDSVGEPLYMLFRGIKHQVDKGPVDGVTGKAKYTLNDNRLLREDLEYHTLTLNAVTQAGSAAGGAEETQGVSVKVLDCDTITQVKEKVLDQVYKGTLVGLRPDPDALDVEWRSGVAGHLILSDEDVTSVVQGTWKRLNTLQHYKVPDGATVALVPRLTKHFPRENQDFVPGEKTPMLEDVDEGGVKLWHLVKPSEEPELPKHRRGSLRDRERAKAIPEIYLTRLLSMKGTLQKFVDDLFQVILSTSHPVPLAIKYFFDLLDEQALQHGISDPETIHIWKTNSLPLRFWINIIKNPQFVFDVQTSDNMDAVLLVIAQTFMDSCTLADHKLGRDSPINKLLYARDIPRYKQMVERYYADIRQTISASDQEMNSALAELSRNYSGDLNALVALHELYKYINKYYDQIITALEEDPTAQKMQLGYRLQQIAASVENKVTDL
ncbi:plexin-B1 [Ornithorhynchus anatinus]|uniref:plexin-B1 n=1 Tax=Ornithorhynchus anatinus TaxID=9258 RepID=UPI0010A79465|nr:plexin-B1 [Ornithorhynchus anatinus]